MFVVQWDQLVGLDTSPAQGDICQAAQTATTQASCLHSAIVAGWPGLCASYALLLDDEVFIWVWRGNVGAWSGCMCGIVWGMQCKVIIEWVRQDLELSSIVTMGCG